MAVSVRHRGMTPLVGMVADGPWRVEVPWFGAIGADFKPWCTCEGCHPEELPQLVPLRWCEVYLEVGPKDLKVGKSSGKSIGQLKT